MGGFEILIGFFFVKGGGKDGSETNDARFYIRRRVYCGGELDE